MKERFLLYIDILGFSDLIINDSEKIKNIYQIVNDLNVHTHGAFQTIVFSDTILVYNKVEPISVHDSEYIVMIMCEFAQDLIYRGVSNNINFRAILTYGEFEHYKLENVECYYGKSLVNAYLKEKEIIGVGLFIDNTLEKFNAIYKTIKYNGNLNFVYLLQTILRMSDLFSGLLPLDRTLFEDSDEFYYLKDDVLLLKKYFYELNSNENPKIRAKYLQSYQFYKKRMPDVLYKLEQNNFSLSTINPDVNWDHIYKH